MFNFLNDRKFMNLLHVIVFGLLIVAYTTDKISPDYRIFIIYLSMAFVFYHLYMLFLAPVKEGMYEGIDGSEQQIARSYNIQGENVHYVRMVDSSPGYDIPKLVISSGDVVVWTNVGDIEHTVTSIDEIFHSGYMKPGENFSVKFSTPGTYPYYCVLHKGWMNGTVIVK